MTLLSDYADVGTDMFKCVLLDITYYVPYQLSCGNIFISLGVKMMKTVICLSS